MISTRRFLARPSALAFEAIGRASPYAWTRKRLSGKLDGAFLCNQPLMASARRSDRSTLAARLPTLSERDRKSTRLNSSHRCISYAVFCLKKKKKKHIIVGRGVVENTGDVPGEQNCEERTRGDGGNAGEQVSEEAEYGGGRAGEECHKRRR